MDVSSGRTKSASQKTSGREHRRKRRRITEDKKQPREFEVGSSKSSGSRAPARNDRTRDPSPEPPLTNGGFANSREAAATKQTFEEGEDFIPFTFSEPPSPSEKEDRNYNKSKSATRVLDGSRSRGWEHAVEDARRDRDRGWDEDKRRHRDRSYSPRPRDKGKGRENGTPSKHHDRKYDMVFDFDDGYANKKERLDPSSRKAPWLDSVDWESCNNVAEMCVTYYECVAWFLFFSYYIIGYIAK
jgi:non-canonical poly(A) RNA polymerase PAPD5/7